MAQPDPHHAGQQRPDPHQPQSLFAPWRQHYVESVGDPPESATSSFIERDWKSPDQDAANHVIVRSTRGLILLNRYPYAGGHVLVALGEPRPRLLEYAPADRAHLWLLVDHAAALIEHALKPQGLNIGINQGRAAGAGVPQHLHVHLVPRWSGDVNFLAVVGATRVIPASLDETARRLRDAAAALPFSPAG
ncbi:MAG: HIT domain-containing protein [Phycisphaeraceae bacterium]|nr:MAG: HIT domain-containing protein [Phycisphaeraceae bacterium]